MSTRPDLLRKYADILSEGGGLPAQWNKVAKPHRFPDSNIRPKCPYCGEKSENVTTWEQNNGNCPSCNKPMPVPGQKGLASESTNESTNTVSKEAKLIDKYVWKICDLGGGDGGYNWMDDWNSPLGKVWSKYFSSQQIQDSMEFVEYLDKMLSPAILQQYASTAKQWYADAKFSIND